MKKPLTRAAIIAGTSLLAATLLTGCAGEKHTFSGMEVSKLDKTIEALDASWSQHRTNAKAANIDEGSRCFVQTGTDGVLAEKAMCGPVRYLGDDEADWDSVALQASPEGKDKVTLTAGESFSKDKPNANTALYRTDGKASVDGANLTEPDTAAAEAEKAIWDVSTSKGGDTSTRVDTPDSIVTASGPSVTDRIGNAQNRLKAGDGRKFATVRVDRQSKVGDAMFGPQKALKTTLAFVTGGKTYPIGEVRGGVVSMSLPGDGSDVALAVGYGDFTQTVTLADGKLHTTATALYDGIGNSGRAETSDVVLGKEQTPGTFSSTLEGFTILGVRSAFDETAGWAPEGKAWLRLTGSASIRGPKYWFNDGNSIGYANFNSKTSVKSASVTNVSGTAFTGELKTDASKDNSGWFNSGVGIDMLFLVPDKTAEFKLSFVLNTAGPRSGTQHPEVPASVNQDYTVPGTQLTLIG
jgi:outer membrane murein-binding lipoprotein Lpp